MPVYKDELLELHKQMVIIKDRFSARDHVDSNLFNPYNELAVEPSHVHRSKGEHKRAVFVLGNALATAMSSDKFSNAGRIGKRIEKLASDAEGRI